MKKIKQQPSKVIPQNGGQLRKTSQSKSEDTDIKAKFVM